MSASLAMQQMLVSALAGVPGITGVFDAPAPDQPSPYLTIGGDQLTDAGHKTGRGHEHRITVTAWAEGPAAAPVKALLAEVEARVLGLAGSRGGHRIVFVRLVRSLVLTGVPGWRQGIIEFRVRTEAED